MTNLVTSSVSQAGEQRGKLATDRGIGVLLEDNLLESSRTGNLSDMSLATDPPQLHTGLQLTRVWLLINRLAVVST